MRLIMVVIFFIPTISSAAIFGANSYEDCMSDGKVGRTGQEMSALQIKCQNEFPKLTKAFRLKDTKFKCVLNTDVISTFKIISNNFFFKDGTPYTIASRTKEKIIVKAKDSIDTKSDGKVQGTYVLNTLDGSMELSFFANNEQLVFKFACEEQ